MHVAGRKNGGRFRFSRSAHPSLYSLHHEYKATSLISAAAADRGCTRRGVYCRKWRALVIPLSGICNRLTYVYIRGFHGDKSTERSREESVPQRGGNPPPRLRWSRQVWKAEVRKADEESRFGRLSKQRRRLPVALVISCLVKSRAL